MTARPHPRFARQTDLLRAMVRARIGRTPRRVAVVGNAPLPESAARAERIDAADAVVRMTTFALDGQRPAVGTRTDVVLLHRATAAGPATFSDYPSRVYLLAEPGRAFWEPEAVPAWWPADLAAVPLSNRELVRPLRRELGLRRIDVAWPTTGTLAVHLAHRLFPHAHIAFTGTTVPDRRDGRAAAFEHAWGPAVALTPEHRLEHEGVLLRRWRTEGWLELVP